MQWDTRFLWYQCYNIKYFHIYTTGIKFACEQTLKTNPEPLKIFRLALVQLHNTEAKERSVPTKNT